MEAAQEFLARQRNQKHPDGKFAGAGRWYPDPDTERCVCCESIRPPSRAWPSSLNKHCRTAIHVANLFGIDVKELRRAVALLKKG